MEDPRKAGGVLGLAFPDDEDAPALTLEPAAGLAVAGGVVARARDDSLRRRLAGSRFGGVVCLFDLRFQAIGQQLAVFERIDHLFIVGPVFAPEFWTENFFKVDGLDIFPSFIGFEVFDALLQARRSSLSGAQIGIAVHPGQPVGVSLGLIAFPARRHEVRDF